MRNYAREGILHVLFGQYLNLESLGDRNKEVRKGKPGHGLGAGAGDTDSTEQIHQAPGLRPDNCPSGPITKQEAPTFAGNHPMTPHTLSFIMCMCIPPAKHSQVTAQSYPIPSYRNNLKVS